ncbi:MAG: thioredoxin [Cyclobacteriaceae bacterium]|nr:thioredoxin [Cyclobacteriaceae bacterium]
MRKYIFTIGITVTALAFVGMIILKNGTNSNSVSNENILDKEEKLNKSNMEKLTKDAFLEKVFNYEQNKEWKYEGDLPCVIDFYADWCGPCKMVHPILEELSKEYDGKIRIYQIDTEAEQELAAAFGIRSIPSLLFCPSDGQPQMAQGALPKASLKKAIEEILLSEKTVEVN